MCHFTHFSFVLCFFVVVSSHFTHFSFVLCFFVVVSSWDDEAVANFRIRNRSMTMFLLLLFLRFVMDNIDDFAAEAAKRKDGDVVLRVFKESARVKVVCLLLFIARVLHLRRFFSKISPLYPLISFCAFA